MSNNDNVRRLAQQAAEDALEGVEFMSVVECTEDLDMELTEDELEAAFRLATRAKAVLPDE